MRTHRKHTTTARKHNNHHASALLKPLKKASKRTVYYVSHKPGTSLGLAALATGLCVSLIYARKLFR